jgi:hypothetical protein
MTCVNTTMSVRRRRPDAAAMTFGDLLQQMINGLSLGAMYALLAPDFTPGATHEIGALVRASDLILL